MLEGSRVVGEWSNEGSKPSTRNSYRNYRDRHAKLVDDGSIAVEGEIGTLTRDVPFPSPSAAGSIAVGYSCNGRIAWTWEGGTYKDWENGTLPLVPPPQKILSNPDESVLP